MCTHVSIDWMVCSPARARARERERERERERKKERESVCVRVGEIIIGGGDDDTYVRMRSP